MDKKINLIPKTIRVDDDDIKKFNKLYSGLLSIYLRKCIKAAIKSKQNFDKIFYEN